MPKAALALAALSVIDARFETSKCITWMFSAGMPILMQICLVSSTPCKLMSEMESLAPISPNLCDISCPSPLPAPVRKMCSLLKSFLKSVRPYSRRNYSNKRRKIQAAIQSFGLDFQFSIDVTNLRTLRPMPFSLRRRPARPETLEVLFVIGEVKFICLVNISSTTCDILVLHFLSETVRNI